MSFFTRGSRACQLYSPNKVLKYKRNITLEPMSAYERRVIHSTIQGIDGVTTKSVGEDPNRKIVVSIIK